MRSIRLSCNRNFGDTTIIRFLVEEVGLRIMNGTAEINNNLLKNRKESQASMSTVSSASSVHSDWSEDDVAKLERKASLQEIIAAAEDKKLVRFHSK